MPLYRVTVTVRGVVSVRANDDSEAGNIAYDYLDGCVESGQAALPVPAAVQDITWNTLVQAAQLIDQDSPQGTESRHQMRRGRV